jgi:heat-inducible transcriptional repressor
MFVDGILEVSEVNNSDRKKIDKIISDETNQVEDILDDISTTLSGVTQGASLVLTPKHEAPIKHVEFLPLSASQALVVLVFADGHVENRLFKPPLGQTPSSMKEAANFLNAIMGGNTLSEAKKLIKNEIDYRRQELDSLAHDLVRSGLALWEDSEERNERLIVKGRANLLNESSQQEDLDRIKNLFDDLERKRDIADFLELTEKGEGVRIFIGSENKLFSLTGSSLVVSPYMNSDRKVIGAVGVIGPTRLNYGRIVPVVDYTAQLVGKMISDRNKR